MIDNTNILEMKKALPFWKHLKEDERELLSKNSSKVCFQKEESIHRNALSSCRKMEGILRSIGCAMERYASYRRPVCLMQLPLTFL